MNSIDLLSWLGSSGTKKMVQLNGSMRFCLFAFAREIAPCTPATKCFLWKSGSA